MERPEKGQVLEGTAVDAGTREPCVETAVGPVRVRGVVPGDRVRVTVTHVGKNALWGELAEVLEPSADRVEPRCDIVARCGGCPWQPWALAAQRREKLARLVDAVGGLAPEPEPFPDDPSGGYGYRNKLLYIAGGRTGALSFGLYEARTHELVPTAACPVHDPRGEAVAAAVRAKLDELRLAPWNGKRRTGTLRAVLMRVAPGSGQVGVTLSVVSWPLARAELIARHLMEIPGVVSVAANRCEGESSVVLGPETALLGGRPRLLAEVGRTRYLLSPTAFFQTNTPMLPAMLAAVEDALPKKMDHLVDLYAGVGLFALALARRARQVTAVEAHPAAAVDLVAAARMQRLRRVHVVNAEAATAELPGPAPDAVVVDPPRAGLGQAVVRRITDELCPRHVAYVSCNPTSLARDLAQLRQAGYRATRLQPLDLFPHTPHLETVTALTRD